MTTYDIATTTIGQITALTKTAPSAALAASMRYEQSVLARLSHPNVVELLDRSPRDDLSFTMVHAGGSDLASSPPRSLDEVAQIVATMAATVEDLHRLGWAHRRISPDHVVRTSTGSVQLCGFRHARETASPRSLACGADAAALGQMITSWLDRLDDADKGDRLRGRLQRCANELHSGAPNALASTRSELAHGSSSRRRLRRWTTRRPAQHIRSGTLRNALRHKLGPRERADVDVATSTGHHLVGSPLREAIGVTIGSVALAAALALIASRIPRSTGPVDPLGSWPVARIVVSGAWGVAAVGSIYGFVVGVLGILVARTDNHRAKHLMDRLAPRMARRIVAGVTLAGFVTTLVATTTPVDRTSNEVATPASIARGSLFDDTALPVLDPVATLDSGPPLDSLPAIDTIPTGTAPAGTGAPVTIPIAPPTPLATEVAVVVDQALDDEWTVRPGDSFWAIARATLASHGTEPTDAEIARYWTIVIEANRSRLIEPSNPDLIVVGQRLTIPATAMPSI